MRAHDSLDKKEGGTERGREKGIKKECFLKTSQLQVHDYTYMYTYTHMCTCIHTSIYIHVCLCFNQPILI